jgi:hypothetical protein
LSAFPISLWWKALSMQTADDLVTKLGRPVDPWVFWAVSGCMAVVGMWAVLKASAASNIDRTGRLLVSAFLGALFVGSSGAIAVIAIAQDQLLKGSAGL